MPHFAGALVAFTKRAAESRSTMNWRRDVLS